MYMRTTAYIRCAGEGGSPPSRAYTYSVDTRLYACTRLYTPRVAT